MDQLKRRGEDLPPEGTKRGRFEQQPGSHTAAATAPSSYTPLMTTAEAIAAAQRAAAAAAARMGIGVAPTGIGAQGAHAAPTAAASATASAIEAAQRAAVLKAQQLAASFAAGAGGGGMASSTFSSASAGAAASHQRLGALSATDAALLNGPTRASLGAHSGAASSSLASLPPGIMAGGAGGDSLAALMAIPMRSYKGQASKAGVAGAPAEEGAAAAAMEKKSKGVSAFADANAAVTAAATRINPYLAHRYAHRLNPAPAVGGSGSRSGDVRGGGDGDEKAEQEQQQAQQRKQQLQSASRTVALPSLSLEAAPAAASRAEAKRLQGVHQRGLRFYEGDDLAAKAAEERERLEKEAAYRRKMEKKLRHVSVRGGQEEEEQQQEEAGEDKDGSTAQLHGRETAGAGDSEAELLALVKALPSKRRLGGLVIPPAAATVTQGGAGGAGGGGDAAVSPLVLPLEWWDAVFLPADAARAYASLLARAKKEAKQSLAGLAPAPAQQALLATTAAAAAVPALAKLLHSHCSLEISKTWGLVQHPVPVLPSAAFLSAAIPCVGKEAEEAALAAALEQQASGAAAGVGSGGLAGAVEAIALPLMLTKQEKKRLRKQRRAERLQDLQDKQKLGLLPPPEPKVRLSNLMRVLKDAAVADPSAMEARVRQQVAERIANHTARNLAQKLTPEERRERWRQKMTERLRPGAGGGMGGAAAAPLSSASALASAAAAGLTGASSSAVAAGPDVALFRLHSLSNGKLRFKVDAGCKECCLTGRAVWSKDREGCVLLYVEGGTRGIRRFMKLMLQSVNWRAKDRMAAANKAKAKKAAAAAAAASSSSSSSSSSSAGVASDAKNGSAAGAEAEEEMAGQGSDTDSGSGSDAETEGASSEEGSDSSDEEEDAEEAQLRILQSQGLDAALASMSGMRVNDKGVGSGPGSKCELIWQGIALQQHFQDFRFEEHRSVAAARKSLQQPGKLELGNLWDRVWQSAVAAEPGLTSSGGAGGGGAGH